MILMGALLLALPGVALAHGYLLRSIPGDRAVLERAPVRVQYWFSEDLEPAYSAVTVYDAEGNPIATGGVEGPAPSLRLVSDCRGMPTCLAKVTVGV